MKFSRIMALIVRRLFGPIILLSNNLNQRLRSNNKDYYKRVVSCVNQFLFVEPLSTTFLGHKFIVYHTHSWCRSWSFSYFYGFVRELWCCTILVNLVDTRKFLDIKSMSSRNGKQFCWASPGNSFSSRGTISKGIGGRISNLRRILYPKPT